MERSKLGGTGKGDAGKGGEGKGGDGEGSRVGEGKGRVAPEGGIQDSPEEWLKRRKYPLPGATVDAEDAGAAQKGDATWTVAQFVAWVQEKGLGGVCDEYVMMKMSDLELEEEKLACNLEENKKKNRHQEIVLLDETRVKLEDGLPGDYIHASYVDGYKQKKAYISTQAPMENTLVDFWRMIWQEKVGTIVMVTRMFEGTEKACPYWPIRQTGKIRYGPIMVTNNAVNSRSTYLLTELTITNLRTEEKRLVNHLYYLDWPDHCVPLFMEGFIHFLERVRQLNYYYENKVGQGQCRSGVSKAGAGRRVKCPIVVHCSAGIGRTGTLEAIDICFRQLVDTARIDVAQVVKRLRKQRAGSVQTPHQFVFIHLVLLYILKAEKLIDHKKIDPNALVHNFK